MDYDPYRASSAPITGPLQKLDIESAGKGRRFLNYLVDTLVYGVLVFLAGMVIFAVLGGTAIDGMISPVQHMLINMAIFVAYYTLMEGVFGFTVGKLLTNTRVVDDYGQAPGLGRALGRSLARFIPFEALSVLFTVEGRGWHDSLARTYVVRRPPRGQPVGRPRVSVSDAFANGVDARRRIEPTFGPSSAKHSSS